MGVYILSYVLRKGKWSDDYGIVLFGLYDGIFIVDYVYLLGVGNLDECNGVIVEGEYVYVLMEDFLYVLWCFVGIFDESFCKGFGGLGGLRGYCFGGLLLFGGFGGCFLLLYY